MRVVTFNRQKAFCCSSHVSFTAELLDEAWSCMAEAGAAYAWCNNIARLPTEDVRLPHPFAALLAIGLWDYFCVCELARGKKRGSGGWHVGTFGGTMSSGLRNAKLRFGNQGFEQRRWSSKLEGFEQLDFPDPDTAEQPAEEFQAVVAHAQPQLGAAPADPPDLAKLHLYMSGFFGYISDPRGFTEEASGHAMHRAYNITFLMQSFLVCSSLSTQANLKQTLHDACRVLPPAKACNMVQGALDSSKRRTPSQTTMSRMGPVKTRFGCCFGVGGFGIG